jgi:ribose transport system substrate-binding protein
MTANRQRTIGLLLAAVTAIVSTAGCSSSTNSTADSSAGASGGSSTATTTASAAVTAKAEAFLTQYESPPTSLGVLTALPKAPAKGKTFVWTECDAPQCQIEGDFMEAAAKAAGWNFKEVDYESADPATLVSALQQALQLKPEAVALTGDSYNTWASVIPAYQAAGVAIIPLNIGPAPLGKVVYGAVDSPADDVRQAQIIANWFIADSNGTGHALLYNVPQFPALQVWGNALQTAVKADCPSCTITVLNQTYAQVAAGAGPSAVVSQLQRDPTIKYVITSDQPLNGALPAALSSVGLSGIKQGGSSLGQSDINQIDQGQVTAGTPAAFNYQAWLAVDAALRFSEGVPVPGNTLPMMLITKSSGVAASDSFNYPPNYQALFEKLWKVGS